MINKPPKVLVRGIVRLRREINLPDAFIVKFPFVTFVLLPFLIFIKFAVNLTSFLKRRPASVLTFLYSLPFIALGIVCWIAGFLKEAYSKRI